MFAWSGRSLRAGAQADRLDGHRRASGPKRSATVVRIAAPVGVVSSISTVDSASGTPLSSSAVPGAGSGIRPCAALTQPRPGGTGLASNRSTPSRSSPTAAPTMSTIESTAPTSWKWIFCDVDPVHAGLGLAQPAEDPLGELVLAGGERALVDHRLDVMEVAMGVLGRGVDLRISSPETRRGGRSRTSARHGRPRLATAD